MTDDLVIWGNTASTLLQELANSFPILFDSLRVVSGIPTDRPDQFGLLFATWSGLYWEFAAVPAPTEVMDLQHDISAVFAVFSSLGGRLAAASSRGDGATVQRIFEEELHEDAWTAIAAEFDRVTSQFGLWAEAHNLSAPPQC
jgi:hypothetical protein